MASTGTVSPLYCLFLCKLPGNREVMSYKQYVKYFFPDAYIENVGRIRMGNTTHLYLIRIKHPFTDKFVILSSGKSPSSTWRKAKNCMNADFLFDYTTDDVVLDTMETVLYVDTLFAYLYE